MKDEIKEILQKIKSVSDFDDYVDFVGTEFKPLLDCITNLQEELEEQKRIEQASLDTINNLQEENKQLKDKIKNNEKRRRKMQKTLQQRIDNAIYGLQCIIDYGFDYDGFNTVESLKGLIDMLVYYARKSKYILQGSDKE